MLMAQTVAASSFVAGIIAALVVVILLIADRAQYSRFPEYPRTIRCDLCLQASRNFRALLRGRPRESSFSVQLPLNLWHTFRIMKGNPKVIEELNKALREELTAINQYFLHAEMCENWGYRKLSEYIKKQSIGEMRHAEVLLERILFLDGVPTMEPLKLKVGSSVKDMIEADLKLEVSAVAQYNAAVQIATEQKDNGSRDLLVVLLKDEESHVDWLEAQVHQINEMGYERYLSMQTGEFKEEA